MHSTFERGENIYVKTDDVRTSQIEIMLTEEQTHVYRIVALSTLYDFDMLSVCTRTVVYCVYSEPTTSITP